MVFVSKTYFHRTLSSTTHKSFYLSWSKNGLEWTVSSRKNIHLMGIFIIYIIYCSIPEWTVFGQYRFKNIIYHWWWKVPRKQCRNDYYDWKSIITTSHLDNSILVQLYPRKNRKTKLKLKTIKYLMMEIFLLSNNFQITKTDSLGLTF